MIFASTPEGQAALENMKRKAMGKMREAPQNHLEARMTRDDTTPAQDRVNEADDTSAENTPAKDAEVQDTKPLTREGTDAPPGMPMRNMTQRLTITLLKRWEFRRRSS